MQFLEEKKIIPELSRAEKVMTNMTSRIGLAMDNRITDLAAATLNQQQWDTLGSEIKQLEEVVNDTISYVQPDLKRIRRYSDAIEQACKEYDDNKLQTFRTGLEKIFGLPLG